MSKPVVSDDYEPLDHCQHCDDEECEGECKHDEVDLTAEDIKLDNAERYAAIKYFERN